MLALGFLRPTELELGERRLWSDVISGRGGGKEHGTCKERKLVDGEIYLVAKHLNFVYMTVRGCNTWNFDNQL